MRKIARTTPMSIYEVDWLEVWCKKAESIAQPSKLFTRFANTMRQAASQNPKMEQYQKMGPRRLAIEESSKEEEASSQDMVMLVRLPVRVHENFVSHGHIQLRG
jgi:hypothetical protein